MARVLKREIVSSDTESDYQRVDITKGKRRRRIASRVEKSTSTPAKQGRYSRESTLDVIVVQTEKDIDHEADDEEDELSLDVASPRDRFHGSSQRKTKFVAATKTKMEKDSTFTVVMSPPKKKLRAISGNAFSPLSTMPNSKCPDEDVVAGLPKGRLWLHSVEGKHL